MICVIIILVFSLIISPFFSRKRPILIILRPDILFIISYVRVSFLLCSSACPVGHLRIFFFLSGTPYFFVDFCYRLSYLEVLYISSLSFTFRLFSILSLLSCSFSFDFSDSVFHYALAIITLFNIFVSYLTILIVP